MGTDDQGRSTVLTEEPRTAAWIGGGDADPPVHGAGTAEPEYPHRATKAGLTAAIVALGTGLLAAAVVIGAFRSRSDDDLDWSNFGVAVGATAVLLVIAVLGSLSARRSGGRAREEVVTWPGAVGILATGLVIGVGIDDESSWVGYLIGGTIVVLAAIGYVASRRAAFVVVGILGLALVYMIAFGDFVADSLGDGHPEVTGAVMVALFVVVITLLGWALPSRAVTGVAVGAVGLAGFVGILVMFVASRLFLGFFGGLPLTSFEEGDGPGRAGFSAVSVETGFHEGDVWWVLALAGLLVVLWAAAAAITNHSGFTILAIAAPAILVPLASAALAAEHPTWWAAILATGGGVLLLGGWFLARLRERRTASELGV
ncbi:hypothetical protein G5V59_18255 [Nocardioides sp. W3-2-3]|uniref:hypothetical protein n=1 Tax=Nocardioides convexus TaxID=2712224 RepID=UPI00241871F3|nr:hypothetical protein [Nocardioides convexus]NHA01149.1 hypothetical protein [Nocardioides convexus]